MIVRGLRPRDPRHGTANGYRNYGCRCRGCREAWRISHISKRLRHPEYAERSNERERTLRMLNGSAKLVGVGVRWGGYARLLLELRRRQRLP